MLRKARRIIALNPNNRFLELALSLRGFVRANAFRWIYPGVAITGMLFAVSSAMTTPVGEDVKVNLGTSRQAEILGGFPAGVLESWDLRGPGQKFFMYFLHGFSSGLVGFQDKAIYELVIKVTFTLLIALIAGIWVFSVSLKRSRNVSPEELVVIFSFSVVALVTVESASVSLQAEFNSALVGLLAISLMVRYPKLAFIAGAIGASTLLFKGVTVFVGAAALFGGLALVDNGRAKTFKMATFGFLASSMAQIAGTWVFMRGEILDLLMATVYQDSFSASPIFRVRRTYGTFIDEWQSVPLLLIGAFATLIVIAVFFRDMKLQHAFRTRSGSIGLLLLSALLGSLVVAIQARGFVYHFASLIPTAFVAFELLRVRFDALSIDYAIRFRQIATVVGIAVLIVPTLIPTGLPAARSFGSDQDYKNLVANQRSDFDLLLQAGGELCSGPIMYFDSGLGAYYFGEKSFLRQTYPLVLSRNSPSLDGHPMRYEYVSMAMGFPDDCILVSDWMQLDRNFWLSEVDDFVNDNFSAAVTVGRYTLWVRKGKDDVY